MRAIFLAAAVLAGCGAETIEDTAYRRLVDRFDSYDACIADGNFATCYQTLTLCSDGRTRLDLDGYRQDGTYRLNDTVAVGTLPTMTFFFDLEKAVSKELPGRHTWELVEPLQYDCAAP